MPYDPLSHYRRSIRLPGYDYTAPGAYFITIATHNRQTIFGEIIDGVIQLNTCGEIARDEWVKTAAIRREIALDEFAIMPNHMHGIIVIDGVRRDTASPCPYGDQPIRIPTIEHFSKPVIGSIPTIIRAYKSAVTYHINRIRPTPGDPVWQSNYYEHIIRDEDDLSRIREYIMNNPLRREMDY
ncbi:MAG: transposase [Anaerolineales bacterium]